MTRLTKDQHLHGPGPKRLLALDGGGVRGVVSLAFLEELERLLKERYDQPDFRLSDYYDLIGGTSTGALIAAGLAQGQTVGELIDTYLRLCSSTFKGPRWFGGFFVPKFRKGPLLKAIRSSIGQETLGSDKLRTGLAIVAKRLDTGSLWVFHNNPRGKFYDTTEEANGFAPNRELTLVSLLRASTAAPTFFEPEFIEVAPGLTGSFVDGGVSPHNNPALLLLMVATLSGYGFRWPTGERSLLLTSVGTGAFKRKYDPSSHTKAPELMLGVAALHSVIKDCEALVETLLQWMSNSVTPWEINLEIGDLSRDLLANQGHFHHQRYNVALDTSWLKRNLDLDLQAGAIARLSKMDQPETANELLEIGRKAAKRQVDATHFPSDFDLAIRT